MLCDAEAQWNVQSGQTGHPIRHELKSFAIAAEASHNPQRVLHWVVPAAGFSRYPGVVLIASTFTSLRTIGQARKAPGGLVHVDRYWRSLDGHCG